MFKIIARASALLCFAAAGALAQTPASAIFESTTETIVTLIGSGHVMRGSQGESIYLQMPNGGPLYVCNTRWCVVTKKPS